MTKQKRVIATRQLTRIDPDGSEHTVNVLLEAPRRAKHGMWTCRFRIENLGTRKDRWLTIHGIDALEAILTCLHIIHVHLYHRRRSESRVTWIGTEDLGIPLMFGPREDSGMPRGLSLDDPDNGGPG